MNPGPPPALHLCLVSNQPVPGLTPLIDPALGTKRVILAAAPERRVWAERLARTLAMYQIPAESLPLADGYDLAGVQAEFVRLRDRFPEGLSVNITGGTKLMAIAAWLTFDRPQDRLYYVQLKTDHIDWLRPAGIPPHAVGWTYRRRDEIKHQDDVILSLQQNSPPSSLHSTDRNETCFNLRSGPVCAQGSW